MRLSRPQARKRGIRSSGNPIKIVDHAESWQGRPRQAIARESVITRSAILRLAMSQEDVQLVRESFLASASGDPDAGQRFWDPSIEWDMSGVSGWAEKQVYRGREVAEFLRAWADSWQGWHFDVEEVSDAAGEMVFVAIREWATGGESGASVDQRRYFVVTVREGRAARVQMFSEAGDAREAAGLPA